MNGLAICSGYDGIGIGLGLATGGNYRTVCHVEREAFAAANLVAQMENGALAPAPIWDDVATFDGKPWRGVVDIVHGGIPCQPFSCAGKRGGIEDNRWLWPAFWRVVRETGAGWMFLENVRGFVFRDGGLEHVLADLADAGWAAEWDCFSAAQCGASQKRERFFILAYAPLDGLGQHEMQDRDDREIVARRPPQKLGGTNGVYVCTRSGQRKSPSDDNQKRDSSSCKSSGKNITTRSANTGELLGELWPARPDEKQHEWECPRTIKPGVGRAVNGFARGMEYTVWADRIRLLGNGVVPIVAALAFRVLWGRLNER